MIAAWFTIRFTNWVAVAVIAGQVALVLAFVDRVSRKAKGGPFLDTGKCPRCGGGGTIVRGGIPRTCTECNGDGKP